MNISKLLLAASSCWRAVSSCLLLLPSLICLPMVVRTSNTSSNTSLIASQALWHSSMVWLNSRTVSCSAFINNNALPYTRCTRLSLPSRSHKLWRRIGRLLTWCSRSLNLCRALSADMSTNPTKDIAPVIVPGSTISVISRCPVAANPNVRKTKSGAQGVEADKHQNLYTLSFSTSQMPLLLRTFFFKGRTNYLRGNRNPQPGSAWLD